MSYTPSEIDAIVGGRLRRIRKIRRLSQTHLGHVADVSFQQIQKYENGANRISASKLWLFATELKVSVSYFFETLENSKSDPPPELSDAAFEIAVLFDGLSDARFKESTLKLIRSIAQFGQDES